MELLEKCPDILTVPEAAKVLKISAAAMREYVKTGQIEQVEIGGKCLIFKPFLLNFIAKRRKVCYNNSIESGSEVSQSQTPQHLDNQKPDFVPFSEGENEMAKIKQPVTINGVKRWIIADSMQEFTDKVIKLVGTPQSAGKHPFDAYALNWFETYSRPNIETVTATTYKRQLALYLIPAFGGMAVEDISTDDVQRLFNGMTGAKATKEKAKMVLNQILDAAVEDKLLTTNPLKSRRVKITGRANKTTPPYTVEQMRFLVQHIGDIKNPLDRAYMALQALHPLRLEEVLGLQGADIDAAAMQIHIRRAVTHPTRNQPEIKDTKTDSSYRTIGLSALALPYLAAVPAGAFIFGGGKPFSYAQVRRMCDRIKKDMGFSENITPIRFRTTVLTDLYDQTKDIKLAQAAAGHTTPAMTLKYYVKGRETTANATAAVDRAYTA